MAEEESEEDITPGEDLFSETEDLVRKVSQELEILEEDITGDEDELEEEYDDVEEYDKGVEDTGQADTALPEQETELEEGTGYAEEFGGGKGTSATKLVEPVDDIKASKDSASVKSEIISHPLVPVTKPPSKTDQPSFLKEIMECETQCVDITNFLGSLKLRVTELLEKPNRTEQDDKELEMKQKLLNDKMMLLEQKTKRIEYLLSCTKTEFGKPREEDALPKVIMCGVTENFMPKIIVCDDKRKITGIPIKKMTTDIPQPACDRMSDVVGCGQPPRPSCKVMPKFAKRLSESYDMQEKLAAENADLEGKRYQLQEDLLDKDQTVENLQYKLTNLQNSMRMIMKENNLLNEKLQLMTDCQSAPPCVTSGDCPSSPKQKKMPCGKGKATCPADIQTRMKEYFRSSQELERTLHLTEDKVSKVEDELVNLKRDRMHVELHKWMMYMSCQQPPCGHRPTVCPATCTPTCPPVPSGITTEQQLRELRVQYNTLQDNYKGKLVEVSGLRADVDKFKQDAKISDESRKTAENKTKECERMLKEWKQDKFKLVGSKEQLVEIEQQLNVFKQRYRETKDELEELQLFIEEQKQQVDDYRNKYLEAQQQIEEQRRQIDVMELENNRINEQVNLEIQRVKNQFQEKLQELAPLPDILKQTQLKVQEAQQMHLMAERNNESLIREIQTYRDKSAALAAQIQSYESDHLLGADEKIALDMKCEEWKQKCTELNEENENMKMELTRLEEVAEESEKRAQEQQHEIVQLTAEMQNVREESARQVSRTKDHCEIVRKQMQNQVFDLERQLAMSRADVRAVQRDRNEIRKKMSMQISNLNENFEDAQMRLRNLRGQMQLLKGSPSTENEPSQTSPDPCCCGNT